MLGFLFPARQTIDEPEPTSEHILPEDAQWLQFNHLVSRAAELRENVLEMIGKLGPYEKVSVLCKVQEIAVEMQGRCGVPVEVLPFGEAGDLPYEQATILLCEVKRAALESERTGDEIAALAGAYCQSMAMACLAGSLADGREQRLDCIALKHDFGQQTGKLLETLQPT